MAKLHGWIKIFVVLERPGQTHTELVRVVCCPAVVVEAWYICTVVVYIYKLTSTTSSADLRSLFTVNGKDGGDVVSLVTMVDLTPEQECALATTDIFNNSTELQETEVALEVQLTALITNNCVGDNANDTSLAPCVVDEDTLTEATAAYTSACEQAGGVVLMDHDVDTTCLNANDLTALLYSLSFRNVDVCAAPGVCTPEMTDFLFLSKGRDVFEALQQTTDDPLVCFDTDCTFVRSVRPNVSVDVGRLPGCPTLAPTLVPTVDSGSLPNRPGSGLWVFLCIVVTILAPRWW